MRYRTTSARLSPLMKFPVSILVTLAVLAVPAVATASSLAGPAPSTEFASASVGSAAASTTPSTTESTTTTQTTTTTTTPTTTIPPVGPVPPMNLNSDRAALNAYSVYLAALLKAAPTAQQNGLTFVSTVTQTTSGCRGELLPLTQQSQVPMSATETTLTALGQEISDDLTIAYDEPAAKPLAKFAATLSTLRWSKPSEGTAIVKHFIAAETTLLETPSSQLCADVLLAASSPDAVPPKTKTFIHNYMKLANNANAALSALLNLMQSYETGSERALIARISSQATQVSKLTKSYLQSTAATLATALETS